ncbi:MAG TPA: hypothetical protein VHJ20_16595 [Polyangia bacterium]|nr:hypothetical protein [Polyangia bacterium]
MSSRAIVCRRCGKKQRVNPRTTLLLTACGFLLVLFGFATVAQRLPFMKARDAAAAAWASEVAGNPLPHNVAHDAISATDLWGLYNIDLGRADARFKNKPVTVTGVISDVRRDIGGGIVLRLVAGESFETVRATVVNHDYAPAAVPLRGQTVSLRCVGRGALIGSPLLDTCAAI